MKRGFSVSTVILVVLLLGVLVWVGKVVNPPSAKDDHDHSEEQAPPAKPMSKEQQVAMQKAQQQKMRDQMKQHYPPPPSGKAHSAPKKDPLDASAWQEHDMGAVTPKPEPNASVPTSAPGVSVDKPKINATQ
jgi:hypothetical protein